MSITNRISLEKITIKNFLIYGNREQEVSLNQGINLVLGLDKSKDRSNGSGKSSLLEAISFALFGKTIKPIKKSEIPNWTNQRDCEVSLMFSIGEDSFLIKRGINPNKLEVYVNGNMIPLSSNVKDYQQELEDKILGMNFKTFCNIVYHNPNLAFSFFNSPAAQKREFLENLFNLEDFSKANVRANEKLMALNQQLSEIDVESSKSSVSVELLSKQKSDLEGIKLNTIEAEREIREIEEKIKDLKTDISNLMISDEDLTKVEEHERALYKEIASRETNVSHLKDTIKKCEASLKKIDVDKVQKDKETLELEKLKYSSVVENSSEIDLLKRISELEEEEKSLQEIVNNLKIALAKIRTRIESISNPDKIKGLSQCPTCGQDVEYSSLKESYDSKISELEKEFSGVSSNKEEREKNLVDLKARLSLLRDSLEQVKSAKNKLSKIDLLISSLKVEDVVKDFKNLNEEINQNIETLRRHDEELQKLKEEMESVLKQKNLIKLKASFEEKIQNLKRDHERKSLDLLTKKVQHKERQDSIKALELQIGEHLKKLEGFEKKKKVLLDLKDHLLYIKTIFKDENIKQFTIQQALPLLENRANHYLSLSGFDFYLKLDGWLEGEIIGPRINKASFGNFSGGESKCIDLALKFSCSDIARLRSKSFVDILILDEILDSSIDATGIKQLIEIIKVKQKEESLKVFIVSHREEINEIECDKIYRVIKESGFSTIKEELR
jgi:DNA repair exonuclease SbcCD ATPase subunit